MWDDFGEPKRWAFRYLNRSERETIELICNSPEQAMAQAFQERSWHFHRTHIESGAYEFWLDDVDDHDARVLIWELDLLPGIHAGQNINLTPRGRRSG